VITTFGAFKGEDLRAGAAAGALIDKKDAFLATSGTESTMDPVEMTLLLFEIVDIDRDRSDKYDNEKKQQIDIHTGLLSGGELTQEILACFVVRQMFGDKLPKCRLMVFVDDMRQFVYDDIFDRFERHFHQHGVETESAVR